MSKLKPRGVKNNAVITPINSHQHRKDDDSQKEKKQERNSATNERVSTVGGEARWQAGRGGGWGVF
jgi:hypothetical protein